jgi:hypothetical protein
MFLRESIFYVSGRRITPGYFINKIIHTENPIKNIYPDISVCMPVAMQENTAGGLQNTVHLLDSLFEPRDIMINAARPPVLKAADFPRVSPDNLVIAVAEKRRVEADEVYAVRFHVIEDFEVVAED